MLFFTKRNDKENNRRAIKCDSKSVVEEIAI